MNGESTLAEPANTAGVTPAAILLGAAARLLRLAAGLGLLAGLHLLARWGDLTAA